MAAQEETRQACVGHEWVGNFSFCSQLIVRAPALSVALQGSKASAHTQKMGHPGDNVGLCTKSESLKHPVLNTVAKKSHLEPRGVCGPQ